MKKILLSIVTSMLFLVCFGQQSKLSKSNELAGDRELNKEMVTAAANYYKLAYQVSPSDVLLVKYAKTAYQAGDYYGVKNLVNDNAKSAEALRFKGLAVFAIGLKYHQLDKDKMTAALSDAKLCFTKAEALGLNVSKDVNLINKEFAKIEF